MPATVYQFPPPPRAGSSKGNGHIRQASPVKSLPTSSSSRSLQSNSHRRHISASYSEDMDCESDSDDEAPSRVQVHVEVLLSDPFVSQPYRVVPLVRSYIEESLSQLNVGEILEDWQGIQGLQHTVSRIKVVEASNGDSSVPVEEADVQIHIYSLVSEPPDEQFIGGDYDDDEERVSGGTIRKLPNAELEGLWENLVYADDIKARLLRYVHSTTAFSDAEIDFNVVTWNRMILLHGPPGTGKTSLCRALAHKLAIRMSDRYNEGRIVEINSHSLFSKWFSESGKLVQQLFTSVNDMADDESCLVIVMIDEVESLTAARAAAMNGNEPGDAVRVVNALLTQLDRLKSRKNVLVMATSNMAGAIDPAFVDRADIKEYVGLPPPEAIYWILTSCLSQLIKGGLIKPTQLANWQEAQMQSENNGSISISARLALLASNCHSHHFSGRFLRRLPLLAYSRYMATGREAGRSHSIKRWLGAMERAVEDEKRDRAQIQAAEGHRQDDNDLPGGLVN